jgi:hypothetical protein
MKINSKTSFAILLITTALTSAAYASSLAQDVDPETLANLTKFAYSVNKGNDFSVDDSRLMNRLINDGWIMTPFMTKTGSASNQVESVGGVIASQKGTNKVVVATRGTVTQADWETNFRAKSSLWNSVLSCFGFGNKEEEEKAAALTSNFFEGVNGAVTNGNLQRHLSSWDEISDNIINHANSLGLSPSQLNLTFAGHSQGAAQAQLNALNAVNDRRFGFRQKLTDSFIAPQEDLGMSFYAPSHYSEPVNNGNVKVMAFEPPRVYGKEAAQHARNMIGEENITNIMNARDPVTMVPPAYMGYSHVGQVINIDSGNYGINPHFMKNVAGPAIEAMKEHQQALAAAPAA